MRRSFSDAFLGMAAMRLGIAAPQDATKAQSVAKVVKTCAKRLETSSASCFSQSPHPRTAYYLIIMLATLSSRACCLLRGSPALCC